MKSLPIVRTLLMIMLCAGILPGLHAQKIKDYKADKDSRVLISSGGGARGAWGVGLARALITKNGHGYDAAFGTSTGSLMSPYILLASVNPLFLDTLETLYTSVTQKSIFNKNPFNVSYNAQTRVVKSGINFWVILGRLLKPTFGETQPLLSLVKTNFVQRHLDMIKQNHKYLGVGVTNMASGEGEIVSSEQVSSADTMDHWIWASANEPLWMSYYTAVSPNHPKSGLTNFIDGGLRDVIPIERGIKFAIDNHIANVDVIINNGRTVIDGGWDPNKQNQPKSLMGLVRILNIYDAGTIGKDTLIGRFMTSLYDCQETCSACKAELEKQWKDEKAAGKRYSDEKDEEITINMYFMDDTTAARYRDELAFFIQPMKDLVTEGKNYFITHAGEDKAVHLHISSHRFEHAFRHLY